MKDRFEPAFVSPDEAKVHHVPAFCANAKRAAHLFPSLAEIKFSVDVILLRVTREEEFTWLAG